MQHFGVYGRALSLLKQEQKIAGFLSGAGFALAFLALGLALLFGWTLAALVQNQSVLTLVLIFAVLALVALGCQLALTQQALRLAHRSRLLAMTAFFEQALTGATRAGDPQQYARSLEIMVRGGDQLYLLISSLFRDYLPAAFSLLLILPVAFWLNAQMAAFLIVSLAIFSGLNVYLAQRALAKQGEVEIMHANSIARAADVMSNARLVQAYVRLEAETRGLDETMQRLLAAQSPALDWFARKSAVLGGCLALSLTGLLAFGGYFFNEARLGLFEIVSLVAFALILFAQAERLTGFVPALLFRRKALADFFAVLDAETVIKEKPGAKNLAPGKGKIEFSSIAYGKLQDFNLSIAPQEAVAVIDAEGNNLSFLADLLLRIVEPQGGRILIDNQDVADVTLASLRQAIAVADGQPLLLNRTIMENLMLGKPDASQDEAIAAVQKAGAHDFIGAKRGGFHTLLKDGTLDESEAERLSIARAILKNAAIIIYDEKQSSSEDQTADVIAGLLNKRAALIFPRRLSTLQAAKRIIVLRNGAIEENGAYDELMQKKGLLAKLVAEGRFAASKITQLKKRATSGGE